MTPPRPPIALVDYGAGNLRSVFRALETCGADVRLARAPSDLDDATAIVIPGVGHFAVTRALDDAWRRRMSRRLADKAAVFGICLGLQWLFDGSDEAPEVRGFGLVPGTCHALARRGDIKVPHVGWNTIERADDAPASRLLAGVSPAATFYFSHGFAAPLGTATCATTSHGVRFASVVEHGRVGGVQFHPEKSGEAGLRVLANVVAIAAEAAC